MKKFAVLIAVLLIMWHLTSCKNQDEFSVIAEELNIDFSGCEILYSKDTHSGFHNDGMNLVVVECSDAAKESIEKALENDENWIRLPLNSELNEALSGITYNDSQPIFTQIDDGCYYFSDRQSSEMKTVPLNERYSYNFTIAIFDSENDKLYFIEFDT